MLTMVGVPVALVRFDCLRIPSAVLGDSFFEPAVVAALTLTRIVHCIFDDLFCGVVTGLEGHGGGGLPQQGLRDSAGHDTHCNR